MDFKGADIISLQEMSLSDVHQILKLADEMLPYANRKKITRVLEGAILGNLFFEPSTRSRVSFASAFSRLGGASLDTTGVIFSSIVKGESLEDTSRVISGYVDCITVRHPEEGSARRFANSTNVPVVNAGDGSGEHPTQGLLDYYTIRREIGGEIDGMTIAVIGDLKNGRTVHSLCHLLSQNKNIRFKFISPKGIKMPQELIEEIYQSKNGHSILETEDLKSGVENADVIYSTRIQEERFNSAEEFERYRGRYSIDLEFVKKYCKKGVVLMHPLPRDSRPESNELDNDLNVLDNLAIFRQTDNGIPIRMAIFALVMGVEKKVHNYSKEVSWSSPEQIDPACKNGKTKI